MKTQIAFLRCLTFLPMFLTASLIIASVSYAQTAEEHPGMFMLTPNHAWIIIQPLKTTVEFVITDPDGLRFGRDPRTNQEYDEFAGSSGIAHGSIYVDPETQAVQLDDGYATDIEFNLKDGTYTMEIIGTGLTEYSIYFVLHRGSESDSPQFDSVIDKDLSTKFQFTFTSDPTKPIGTATRLATPGSLKEDIELAYKTELYPPGKEDRNVDIDIEVSSNVSKCYITDRYGGLVLSESCSYTYTAKKVPSDGVYRISKEMRKKLLEKADKIEKAINEKKLKKARKATEDILKHIKEYNEKWEKHLTKKDDDKDEEDGGVKKLIDYQAYKILTQDVEYILSTLPPADKDDDKDENDDD